MLWFDKILEIFGRDVFEAIWCGITYKSKSEKLIKKNQINQSFRTICHTKVCLTILRMAGKLSEMITNVGGCNLKIQRLNVIRPHVIYPLDLLKPNK